uniref:Uncharacterized protein n=1 Tax=Bombyx mori TaxID=7091 RepID=A0A8R2R7A1_BOMMO|nr:uncharacterized protein LOC101743303 isoform X1 [Bombyx mori]
MLQPRISNSGGGAFRMSPKRSFVVLAALFLCTTLTTCQDFNSDGTIESSRIKREGGPENRAFNTNAIVYDNTPWMPGRDLNTEERSATDMDERKLKNVATKVMANGVELLVKDKSVDGKHEQTKYMEVKTIQPTASLSNMFVNSFPKADKRIDNEGNFDIIQPSEVSHVPCTTSCSCSHSQTEGLNTKHINVDMASSNFGLKTSQYGGTILDFKSTKKETLDKKTQYEPYEYESSSQLTPTDRIVEKYTEIIGDYSDEKDSSSVEESELLTNEQAPGPPKTNKIYKSPEKNKPDQVQKPNKNKFVVADLLKLGTLGIKGLTRLAPVLEKMTGGFIKRHDNIADKTTTTTQQPAMKLTAYSANKRIDTDIDVKKDNFPIYIPVDELETSESQLVFTNATLHQNLAWVTEHKYPKAPITPPKFIHESPLVNGGIPISPGEIITANSDLIVGTPAVGRPLTLAASGIKLHNQVNPPPIDSFVSANEQYLVNEKPMSDQPEVKVDDSFDLRPPDVPKNKPRPRPLNGQRPYGSYSATENKMPFRKPSPGHTAHDQVIKPEKIKTINTVLGNHGRPVFLDYIPSLAKPAKKPNGYNTNFNPSTEDMKGKEILDNSPSSSEIVNTQIKTESDYTITGSPDSSKPFLVDIQPSRVANVLIPHGSSTALVFAGSSEPHKTGDYVDDPLPYPEPGYFGSFSIDAPQMTNVHNVAPNGNQIFNGPNVNFPLEPQNQNSATHNKPVRNDVKVKWNENKRPDINNFPPTPNNQEGHVRVSPQISAYKPNLYSANTDFGKLNQIKGKDGKEFIDKEYENFLAVPPPPLNVFYNTENTQENQNKPYNQRPIVHTKPVQDMKVFLNAQHPQHSLPKEQLPPKVTSEIYFASQAPNNKPTPSYTIHIPPVAPSFVNTYNKLANVNRPAHRPSVSSDPAHSFPISSSLNMVNKSIAGHSDSKDDTSYTVTLNTATNVAGNVGDRQIIGSSAPVSIGTSSSVGLNTDIPIGTNFAIRVEDNSGLYETHNVQGQKNPFIYDEHGRAPSVIVGDSKWIKSESDKIDGTIVGHKYFNENVEKPALDQAPAGNYKINNRTPVGDFVGDNRWNKSSTGKTESSILSHSHYNNNAERPIVTEIVRPTLPPSLNSHANFPMINEETGPAANNVKPVHEINRDVIAADQKRPPKLIPNIPTNSHGWYSSILNDNVIHNIKIDITTQKSIPLIHDHNENGPDYGEKLPGVGKPPPHWQHSGHVHSNMNLGKPFTKATFNDQHRPTTPPLTTKPNKINYIPANFGAINQQAYDIPIRDNSHETTTSHISTTTLTEREKPIYENSEEIYDGEDESDSTYDTDGEVSLESMKVPVISASNELKVSTSSTEITLLQDEVFNPPKQESSNKNKQVDFNHGTQTEKPFIANNRTGFKSNAIKPIYENKYQSMKPRPFTMNNGAIIDHQLQQPHWQINHMMENSTNASYESNLDLNIGEEIPSSPKPVPNVNTQYYYGQSHSKDKQHSRPEFSKSNYTQVFNDTNIITSTVHIKDKKPLIVEKATEKSTLHKLTITTESSSNKTSTEIIDLSPPPPTMDYNFKPSTNDEMIMGMSPPPRMPPAVRLPPRMPITPRPIPVRTPPSYRLKPQKTTRPSTQRPVRKPINRDEVSTYRPHLREEVSTFRPHNRDDISTYRPIYDILNNVRRPIYNNNQPSSQLLPPPRDISSEISSASIPNIVFPTPTSSGWLTSSGVEFSSSFDFGPTSVQFPAIDQSSITAQLPEEPSSDNSYSYEVDYSSERSEELSSQKPETTEKYEQSNEASNSEPTTTVTTEKNKTNEEHDSVASESVEDTTTENKTIQLDNKNRVRKPYPVRLDDRKSSTYKFKLPKPTAIKPTRTLSRSDILYPTRHTSIKKIIRPIPTRYPAVSPPNIIESSESSANEEFIKPTEVLKESTPTPILEIPNVIDHQSNIITSSMENISPNLQPTHHAGNEIRISDDIVPTKTEFRTTVVTLTKTLSEPPKTVSSIDYVNLTHTLTVTLTETSLLSQSEGAVTETLVLTNTHTSTIVDVVTKVQTQVQPTTIIETVTKHIPIQVEPTPVQETSAKTKIALDDVTISSEENDNFIIRDSDVTENIQKIDTDGANDSDTFFVVMNKSQNGGHSPPVSTSVETEFDDLTRNEQVNSNGVSQVLFGEILLAGAPYLETTNVGNANGPGFGKECQPDCKASRNERCQRIDGLMKCVCRPGFARMFPDRPCKPTYTYSVKLALASQGESRLQFQESLSDNSSKEYQALAVATHEGINRMVMQSDLRDVYHGIHIAGFHPVEIQNDTGTGYQGVMNDFYVQLSDNAHENRLKEVLEKYLRNNNYSLGGTDVHAASELLDKMDVSDFDECTSGQFHDCSEHAQCFNLRGTYTCSCLEGFADLSVNNLYPGRICSAEPVGCARCNYHGTCYSRDDKRVLCECFQWYSGSTCQINLKVVLISLVVAGALLTVVLAACAVIACRRSKPPQRSIVTCIQGMPTLHQGAMPKQRNDRRALISEQGEPRDNTSIQNASLPYMPAKRPSSSKKLVISDPPSHDPPPPPAPAVLIPRARFHPHHGDSRENLARKRSLELSSEAKLISYLESGAATTHDEMRRKHSLESSYSANRDRPNKKGALVSAGFKVSTTIRPDENMKDDRDDMSSVNKAELEADLARFDSLRKAYSQDDMSEWTDAERRLGELTLSEARSVGGTLPASTGRAASSTRLTHQEANTMAERDLGSTFLLPHVHLYKPDLTSDVSEFDSL